MGAGGDAGANFGGGAVMGGGVRAVHADQIIADVFIRQAQHGDPFAHHLQRQFPARHGARPGIGDLPLADETVAITDRDFQRVGTRMPLAARDGDAVGAFLGQLQAVKSATTSA
jgi:hypothetical protein